MKIQAERPKAIDGPLRAAKASGLGIRIAGMQSLTGDAATVFAVACGRSCERPSTSRRCEVRGPPVTAPVAANANIPPQ